MELWVLASCFTRVIIRSVKLPKVYPLLVILLAVFAVAPLEYPGAFQSHSGLLAYYNLIDLDQNPSASLRAGPAQFFAWAPVVGRAFDLFRTDGALPYLVSQVFHLLGWSYLNAIKLVYALAWIASGLTMYALARRWLSENGALLAATVYVYLPFHIATIYVRGAFVEAAALAVMPAALLALNSQPPCFGYRSAADTLCGRIRALSLLPFAFPTGHLHLRLPQVQVCFAMLFLIQPGFAVLFALVALAITAALRGREWSGGLWSVVSGLVVGALLYLPTILRYDATIGRDGFNPNFVLPFQLFSALWGFGASTGSYLDQFPFQLGVVPLGLAIIVVALAWRGTVESDSTARSDASRLQADVNLPATVVSNRRRVIAVFLGAAIVLTLLTFQVAAPLWRVLGVFVVYPWQLLAFVGFALAIVAGAAIEFNARLARPAMTAFFVALPIVASYGYLAPRFLDVNPARPPIAIFGDNEIALWDYRIVGPLRHGATVRLHLTWQALRPVNHDYTVFVHGVHEDGGYYAQADSKPQGGALPTTQWQPGQVISDTHMIQIDVDGPREDYHLEFGLYVAATGKRAITTTGAGFVSVPRPGDPEPIVSEQVRPGKK